jgi:hypothetical protein
VQKTEDAIQLIEELRRPLGKRSFRLTKFVSNDVKVLSSIPESERAKFIVSLDFDELQVERTLGVEWNVKEDTFNFRTAERKKAPTRRGLPNAIYSDNGSNFVAGNRILKEEFERIKCDEAQLKIQHSLRAKEVGWHFNPPLASHCGGIWKRMIRSIRRILAAVMNEQVVDDEAFQTFCKDEIKID